MGGEMDKTDSTSTPSKMSPKPSGAELPKASAALRMTILVTLAIQNAGHALLTRYSRGILREEYNSTELVIVAELIKFFFSAAMFLNEPGPADGPKLSCLARLGYLLCSSANIIVLVIIYAMSNLLVYYALARVDAGLYTVISQLKILTTAIFAVTFLGSNMSMTRWRALMLLVIGCILVASPSFGPALDTAECATPSEVEGGSSLGEAARRLLIGVAQSSLAPGNGGEFTSFRDSSSGGVSSSSSSSTTTTSSGSDSISGSGGSGSGTSSFGGDVSDGETGMTGGGYDGSLVAALGDQQQLETVLGMCAVFAMTAISGFSSVYFEAILKPKAGHTGPSLSIWGRNFQLAFFSLLLLLAVLLCEQLQAPVDAEPYVLFRGWGTLPIIIALTQASGGLLVALALRYTDAILKVVATSGSIVLSTVLGTLLLDGKMDSSVVLGVSSTIIAIFNYTFE